ncbi:DUF992 domain-containing protein [Mangrovicella endophytica]|uniref:DUF992 domain-containing protein n=1 Tax=Mangrovicella endophytica TaxID=2066697 RepID=UPI000C9DB1BD|nr:DUF992 domain-containing protein [Mangrovicella endophytica]
MKAILFSAALAGALLAGSAAARADAELGSLTCHSEGSTGFIIGSSENVLCEFTPANNALPKEVYTGTLSSLGLDVGVTGETVMKWVVLAATPDKYSPASLAGSYVGASADASFAAGAGVKVLVGGPNGGFTLQPLSVQAQEGVNAAIGVTKFTLAPAVAVAPGSETVVITK